jgi:hypothetical protein
MIPDAMICPRCAGHNPADARFCIDCSAPLTRAATAITRLLSLPPIVIGRRPRRPGYMRLVRALAGSLVLAPLTVLLLLGYRPNGNIGQDSIAALLLLIGGIQLVRFTRQGKFAVGLRAGVICVALVVASETPWMLTSCVITAATLATLHISEILGRHFQQRQP